MGIKEWEQYQRSAGNEAAAEMGKTLFKLFGDVPSETEKTETKKFSNEARKALEKEGYVVYELTGQSIASLREQGKAFWSIWHKDYPDFEALTSRRSEVAINPKQFFLPKSNNKTLSEQEALVAEFSADISAKVSGVEAVMGGVSDYTELAFLSPANKRLFGEKYDYNYTRTQTRVGSNVANVGRFFPDNGLFVDCWGPGDRSGSLFVAPLVVPAGNK